MKNQMLDPAFALPSLESSLGNAAHRYLFHLFPDGCIEGERHRRDFREAYEAAVPVWSVPYIKESLGNILRDMQSKYEGTMSFAEFGSTVGRVYDSYVDEAEARYLGMRNQGEDHARSFKNSYWKIEEVLMRASQDRCSKLFMESVQEEITQYIKGKRTFLTPEVDP